MSKPGIEHGTICKLSQCSDHWAIPDDHSGDKSHS